MRRRDPPGRAPRERPWEAAKDRAAERERVGPPDNPGDGEARERVLQALETIQRLILEHGDEIDADYRQRVGQGEEHLAALVAAKRDAITKTEEGRRAWEIAEALEERRGEG